MSTCSAPTGIHSYSVETCVRSSASIPSRSKNAMTVTTNEPASIAVAR